MVEGQRVGSVRRIRCYVAALRCKSTCKDQIEASRSGQPERKQVSVLCQHGTEFCQYLNEQENEFSPRAYSKETA